jgi:hypothetical protein
MAFYSPDAAMGAMLEDQLRALELQGRPGLGSQVSITWLRYPRSLIGAAEASESPMDWPEPVAGAAWAGSRPRYPASVVKLFYLAATEAWLQRQLLEDGAELRRAMADMIRDSSNDATAVLVDWLTGTTSGPDLPERPLRAWIEGRQLVNQWYAAMGWSEFEGCNVCQKTWGDGPYGRERQFYGPKLENRNRLSTDATARLLHLIMAGALVSPPACARMRELLSRSLDSELRAADPENQVDGFIGAGLPATARLWSKAGWMSQARHDAAYVEIPDCAPFLLVIFSEGGERAADEQLLPELSRRLSGASEEG